MTVRETLSRPAVNTLTRLETVAAMTTSALTTRTSWRPYYGMVSSASFSAGPTRARGTRRTRDGELCGAHLHAGLALTEGGAQHVSDSLERRDLSVHL